MTWNCKVRRTEVDLFYEGYDYPTFVIRLNKSSIEILGEVLEFSYEGVRFSF